MIVTISGKRRRLLADSFSMEDAVGERSVCSFTVIDKRGDLKLRKNDPVLVWDTEGFRIFGGVIEIPQRIRSGTHYLWGVICADWHYLADKRVVRASYEQVTAGDIVRDLVAKILSEEGVEIDYTEADFTFLQGQFPAEFGEIATKTVYDGPLVEEAVFNYIPVSQAMDSLAELAGYWWMIDQFRRLWFVPRTANRLNLPLTRSDMEAGSISVENANVKYRNRQYIRGGKDVTDPQVVERAGDGVTTAFTMDYPIAKVPTVEIMQSSRTYLSTYLAVASGATLFIYKREGNAFTRIAVPELESGSYNVSDIQFSANGGFLGVVQATSHLAVFKRDGDTFTKLPNLEGIPASSLGKIAFSPNGDYLVVGISAEPYMLIYRRFGDSFLQVPSPTVLPAGAVRAITFSGDGSLLAVGHASSPYLTIYKHLGGDQFGKLPNPAELPVGEGKSISFSPGAEYLAVLTGYAPRLFVYRQGENGGFVRLPAVSQPPTDMPQTVAFSADGNHLAVGQANSPRFFYYRRDGDSFTLLPNPDGVAFSSIRSLAFSQEGSYLAVAMYYAPYLHLFKLDGDELHKLPDPATMPTAASGAVAFSPDVAGDASWSPQTVGIRGVEEGRQWYWNKGDAVISQDAESPPLQAHERVRVTYRGEFDIVVITQDTDEVVRLQELQNTSGIVEDVSDDYNIASMEAGFQLANAKLAKYANIGRRLKFRAYRWGLDPGKLVEVDLPEYGIIKTEMLIESCEVEVVGGVMFYRVTCVEGELEGSWTNLFRAIEAESRLPVIRQNISEQEVLLISEQFADAPMEWGEALTDYTYSCFVPSSTLYPSATLYPC